MKSRKTYKEFEMQVIIYGSIDIITESSSETEDDFGSWNSDWFTSAIG